jgi:spermidine dehydrogenase
MIPGAIPASTFDGILNSDIAFGQLDRSDNPVRIRLDSTAVRVEHEADDRVAITYSNNGKLHRLRAKSVVMASGGWVNRHVIADMPQSHHDAYSEFVHAPVLVANVALRNWRFLERLGLSAAIWSGGFGFTCNIRRPMVVGGRSEPLDPDKPIVLTFYAPIFKPGMAARQQGVVARAEMLSTSFADYERQIREQMTTMFSASGFDAARDIAGVILNRWGHAYVAPGPGFMFGLNGNMAPPDVIRQRIGRIAIGHSELRGHQYWSGAAGEGRRAVESLLDSAP